MRTHQNKTTPLLRCIAADPDFPPDVTAGTEAMPPLLERLQLVCVECRRGQPEQLLWPTSLVTLGRDLEGGGEGGRVRQRGSRGRR